MKCNILVGMIVLMVLVACGSSNERTKAEQDSLAEVGSISDSLVVQGYKVTFLELGAESCIPCKMMKPIMRDIAAEYPGVVEVIFHDLYRDREVGQRWNVLVMPTQVFLDSEGREFFRHEGFYPKDELKEMLDNYLASLNPE